MLVNRVHSVYFLYSLFQSCQQRVRVGFCQNYHPSWQHLHTLAVVKASCAQHCRVLGQWRVELSKEVYCCTLAIQCHSGCDLNCQAHQLSMNIVEESRMWQQLQCKHCHESLLVGMSLPLSWAGASLVQPNHQSEWCCIRLKTA